MPGPRHGRCSLPVLVVLEDGVTEGTCDRSADHPGDCIDEREAPR
ncbi:hypothetical protein [Aeromicrobium sp. Leaf291]|nr:hypothetical protein [Aeromicrobium sp. Leaf291]